MENRTKYIPSLVMLLAAFITCVVSIYYKYTTRDILIIVLITIVVFFIIGTFIRMLAEKYLKTELVEEALDEESDEGQESENSEKEKTENQQEEKR